MRVVTIFFAIILFSAPVFAETLFFEAMPDIPVASGLEILPDEGVSFDKPDGRIAEAVAVLAADGDHPGAEGIVQYYDTILPSFGWIKVGDQRYMRGEEALKFWFEPIEGRIYFHLLVQPADLF
jgi:hypothetical protein